MRCRAPTEPACCLSPLEHLPMVTVMRHRVGRLFGILKQLKDEMTADLNALEKEELDRKTNHQDLMKANGKLRNLAFKS